MKPEKDINKDKPGREPSGIEEVRKRIREEREAEEVSKEEEKEAVKRAVEKKPSTP